LDHGDKLVPAAVSVTPASLNRNDFSAFAYGPGFMAAYN
jgi:hypothetical protein